MAIDFTNPPGIFATWWGPGVSIDVRSNVASPPPGPYSINVEWRFNNNEQLFYSESSTNLIAPQQRFIVLWHNDLTIAPLINANTLPVETPLSMNVVMRDDTGNVFDQGAYIRPWDPVANVHLDTSLLLDAKLKATGGGTLEQKIDQILAAVYRTWPSA